MSEAIRVTYSGEGAAGLARLVSGLKPAGRARMNSYIAAEGRVKVKSHILTAAGSRHQSANRLGASPTGHLGLAAESVSGTSDENAATISITSPGFKRVAGPLTIKPVNARALTIPINALAYGKRVSEVENELGQDVFQPKGTRILAITTDDGELLPLYFLAAQVTIPQDRGLLPSDLEIRDIGIRGIRNYVGALIRQKEAA